MKYICKLCNKEIEGNAHFWDNHRIKISSYFETHEPRLTKTGKKVLFVKDIDKYFETDFNDLNERKLWAKQNPEIAKEYFIDLLVKRKIKKNWIYAPGQTMLSLCNLPKIIYYEREFGQSFSEICKKLGFKIRYINKIPDIDWSESIDIVIDTREQNPLKFDKHIKTSIAKIDYGDICLLNDKSISIERKSINDLVSTLSSGYDRFKREITRAKKNKGYLIILCESSFNDLRSIEYIRQTKYSKCSYDFIAKRIRDLYEEFDCIQFCFAADRKHSSKIVEFILKSGKSIKKIDIQLLIDKKLI